MSCVGDVMVYHHRGLPAVGRCWGGGMECYNQYRQPHPDKLLMISLGPGSDHQLTIDVHSHMEFLGVYPLTERETVGRCQAMGARGLKGTLYPVISGSDLEHHVPTTQIL